MPWMGPIPSKPSKEAWFPSSADAVRGPFALGGIGGSVGLFLHLVGICCSSDDVHYLGTLCGRLACGSSEVASAQCSKQWGHLALQRIAE